MSMGRGAGSKELRNFSEIMKTEREQRMIAAEALEDAATRLRALADQLGERAMDLREGVEPGARGVETLDPDGVAARACGIIPIDTWRDLDADKDGVGVVPNAELGMRNAETILPRHLREREFPRSAFRAPSSNDEGGAA